ncbi:hypothetical protein CP557_17080 [Natrinema ejinorense]|uniref:Uncharacterized protein n=1 Tax=Natrinema ejinorense TaxID=373386 RepID=A0A2A5QZ20_9EURY|nr:hypothetical protein CP557_17080 [Natrinema ejinorense]
MFLPAHGQALLSSPAFDVEIGVADGRRVTAGRTTSRTDTEKTERNGRFGDRFGRTTARR